MPNLKGARSRTKARLLTDGFVAFNAFGAESRETQIPAGLLDSDGRHHLSPGNARLLHTESARCVAEATQDPY